MTTNPARVMTSDQPAQRLTIPEIVEHLAVGLAAAAWHYDAEIDELELVLPGGAGRAAGVPWPSVSGDVYVRLDAETDAALSVIIPAWTWWLGEQALPAAASPAAAATPGAPDTALPAPERLDPHARRTALDGLVRHLRAHTADLAAAPPDDATVEPLPT